jgi:hypothetical protein
MKKYQKFYTLSESTKQELIKFTENLVAWIEIYGNDKNDFVIKDFQKGNFDLQKIVNQKNKMEEVTEVKLLDFYSVGYGIGSPENRRVAVDLRFKYEPKILLALNDFLNQVKAIKKQEVPKKINEAIRIPTLGIIFNGVTMTKGSIKKMIMPTDVAILKFLYQQHLEDSDECFSTTTIAEKCESTPGYIKNRISELNKIVMKITKESQISYVGSFIKNEKVRGYHLNPKLFPSHKK